MKSTYKKLGALALVVVMLLALSVPAFADGTLTAGVDGTGTTAVSTLTFGKQIKVFNPEAIAVRLPAITYTYTITPVTVSNATVQDSDGDTAKVLSGVDVGDIFTSASQSISFAQSETVTAGSSGVLTAAKDVSFSVKSALGSSVTRAGIYRYQVTESTNINKDAAGILQPTGYATTKYLDVYVANVGTELKVVGFVLFDSDNAATQDLNPTNAAAQKSDGWGEGKSSSETNTDVDEYHTYNLTVTKQTTGNMADKTNQFPITVKMTKAAGLTNDVTVDVSVSTGNTLTSAATVSLGSNVDFQASLKDGGSLYIKGIPYFAGTTPAYATINSVTEVNNTVDSYKASVDTVTNLTSNLVFEDVAIAAGGNKTTTGSATFVADNYSATLPIKNTMSDVSPTGVVLRVAPYALMLGIGMILVLFTRRRKAEEEA